MRELYICTWGENFTGLANDSSEQKIADLDVQYIQGRKHTFDITFQFLFCNRLLQ